MRPWSVSVSRPTDVRSNKPRSSICWIVARLTHAFAQSASEATQKSSTRSLSVSLAAVVPVIGVKATTYGGGPDESGQKRRERGLAKAGNARVRRGMIQLAWGHLAHQKDRALSEWYRRRTSDAHAGTRKTMIVALARKLLIALWRLVTTGDITAGLLLRPTAR